MLIACPACATRYAVPDSAIGVEGRSVRCAKCRHNWFQEGSAIALPDGGETQIAAPAPPHEEPAPAETRPPDTQDVSAAAVVAADPGATHEQEPDAGADGDRPQADAFDGTGEAYGDPPIIADTGREAVPVAVHDDGVSQFAYEPPFRPRRNPLKLWTLAAAVFALLAVGAIAAVSFWGLPDWVPMSRPTFAVEQPDLVLEFPPEQQDRRTLPNGTEFFGASGSVTNVGRETHSLPPILIVLRDGRERIVYSWEVAPPQASLAPGETVSINEAVTDVPRSARFAEIGWKPS